MSSTKLYVAAALLSGTSVVIVGGTAAFIAAKGIQRELEQPSSTIGQAIATFSDIEETLVMIRGDEEGEFGERMESLRSRYPFTRPDDGVITEEQVLKFIRVKERFLAVDDEMIADMERSGSAEPTPGQMVKWNFFSRMRRLRAEQAAGLEEVGMSLDEFRFVHASVYAALFTEGMDEPRPARDRWQEELREKARRSEAEIDRELADPATTEERRRQLRTLREELERQTEMIGRSVEAIQSTVESIPEENIALVARHQEALARVMLAGVDLDAIEFFRALETSGANLQ